MEIWRSFVSQGRLFPGHTILGHDCAIVKVAGSMDALREYLFCYLLKEELMLVFHHNRSLVRGSIIRGPNGRA